jgi:hypothetical protein
VASGDRDDPFVVPKYIFVEDGTNPDPDEYFLDSDDSINEDPDDLEVQRAFHSSSPVPRSPGLEQDQEDRRRGSRSVDALQTSKSAPSGYQGQCLIECSHEQQLRRYKMAAAQEAQRVHLRLAQNNFVPFPTGVPYEDFLSLRAIDKASLQGNYSCTSVFGTHYAGIYHRMQYGDLSEDILRASFIQGATFASNNISINWEKYSQTHGLPHNCERLRKQVAEEATEAAFKRHQHLYDLGLRRDHFHVMPSLYQLDLSESEVPCPSVVRPRKY